MRENERTKEREREVEMVADHRCIEGNKEKKNQKPEGN